MRNAPSLSEDAKSELKEKFFTFAKTGRNEDLEDYQKSCESMIPKKYVDQYKLNP